MLPRADGVLHSGRDRRSCSTHRRSALPGAANNEVLKVQAAKYFRKFDHRHGPAWAKTLSMRLSLHITHHGTLPVEIPQNLRDMSEQNMKQAHAEYENLTDFVIKAMGIWMGVGVLPANPMAAGFHRLPISMELRMPHKAKFRPIQLKDGAAWYVLYTPDKGPTEHLEGFYTEEDAL